MGTRDAACNRGSSEGGFRRFGERCTRDRELDDVSIRFRLVDALRLFLALVSVVLMGR